MSDTFDCPKCGASYTRERRRVGKAVVCACGHKFLVPAGDAPMPTASRPEVPPPSPPAARTRGRAAPVHRTPDRRTPTSPAAASDASGEVIPLAEPVQPASSPSPVRWAEPVEPSSSPSNVRWAEPVEPHSVEPLVEAEVVDADSPYAEPIRPEDDIFGPASPYATPVVEASYASVLPSAPPPPPPSVPAGQARRKPRAKRPTPPVGIILLAVLYFLGAAIIMAAGLLAGLVGRTGGAIALALIVGILFAALFIAMGVAMLQGAKWAWWLSAFVQAWSLCNGVVAIITSLIFANQMGARAVVIVFVRAVIGFVINALMLIYYQKENVLAFFRLKRLDTGHALSILFGLAFILTVLINGIVYVLSRPRGPQVPLQGIAPSTAPSASPRAANEPPPSGYAITIWNAARSPSGEFSVEYRLDKGALDSSRQYFWVVDDRHGRIEFPIPANAVKPHDKLSGRPAGLTPGQFTGPYTTFIEEQSGSSRNRVSNELPF